MSFTVPLPPRTQLYHRSCSNKHTHPSARLQGVAIVARPELAAISRTLQATPVEIDLLYLCDSQECRHNDDDHRVRERERAGEVRLHYSLGY